MKTNISYHKKFIITFLLSVIAWGGWEVFAKLLEESAIHSGASTFLEFTPFYLLILVAFYAGCVGNSFLNCLIHSTLITVVVIGLSFIFSAIFKLEYAHDIWVDDPGFINFILYQLILVFLLTTIVVEAIYFIRVVRLKLKDSV
jgi:hypothetical protein